MPPGKLVGCLIARGDEPEPYAVPLQSSSTITGRLRRRRGQAEIRGSISRTIDWQIAASDPARGVILYGGQKTDAEGRFRYEGLVPGQEYSANVPWAIRPAKGASAS